MLYGAKVRLVTFVCDQSATEQKPDFFSIAIPLSKYDEHESLPHITISTTPSVLPPRRNCLQDVGIEIKINLPT